MLIFKQSAGTGFDAPRAFVLASTKPVNDSDFAMQFIGRVMRIARQVREGFPKPHEIPADLNTAYVYLGNAQAQAGFEAAVQATSAVKTQLEGQTEKLMTRHTMAGGVVYTNRPTPEKPLAYNFGLPSSIEMAAQEVHDAAQPFVNSVQNRTTQPPQPLGQDLFGEVTWALDTTVAEKSGKKTVGTGKPRTQDDVMQALSENRLRVFHLKRGLPTLGVALKSEEKPTLVDLSAISLEVAQSLPISPTLAETAVQAALHRIKQKEMHKELTEGTSYVQEIQVVTDRSALAREALAALQELPHAEEEDYRIIVQTLCRRLRPSMELALLAEPAQTPLSDIELMRLTRDAAHWVIRDSAQELREGIFQAIADQSKLVKAQPLPDVMIFPEDIALEQSSKNIYGVLPPITEDAQNVESVLFMDERYWWADQVFTLDDGKKFSVGRYDGAVKLNSLEQAFARALDEADFVHWWHRNPDKKPYSVRVVRAEHEHYFYPDFVVCVSHEHGEAPMQRLLETKESTKDAARKAQHFPATYGKVLFLTPDGNRLRWVNDNGSLGDVVKLSELETIHEKLKSSKPTTSPKELLVE